MALTRKLLEGMGIEEKQVETIIEAHLETVNGLKADRDKFKEQAEKAQDLQKQLEEAKAAATDSDGWKQKHEELKKEFESFKASVDAEKAEQLKAKAYRHMLEKAGIDPKRIDSIMRVTDLSKVETEGDGLKDSEKLAEAAKQEWSDFVVKTKTEHANPENPPKATGGVEGADPSIAKRLQERHERLYGKTQNASTEE